MYAYETVSRDALCAIGATVLADVEYYSDDDRRKQLRELAAGLDELVQILPTISEYADATPRFQHCLDNTRKLLGDRFTTEQLQELSHQVSPVIDQHPHWDPPLEQQPDGSYREPAWFSVLEPVHTRVMKYARLLRVIGEY